MRITSKGRLTIPAKIRELAGLLPGTEVDIEFDGNGVRMGIVAHLRASADVAMTTDEIMALTRGE